MSMVTKHTITRFLPGFCRGLSQFTDVLTFANTRHGPFVQTIFHHSCCFFTMNNHDHSYALADSTTPMLEELSSEDTVDAVPFCVTEMEAELSPPWVPEHSLRMMHYSANIQILTHAMLNLGNPMLLDKESGPDFIDVSLTDDQDEGAMGGAVGHSGPPPLPVQQPRATNGEQASRTTEVH